MNDRDLNHFEHASRKGSDRIQINNLLAAVCIGSLSILLTLKTEFSTKSLVLLQFAFSIPLLVSSSLAYAKLALRERIEFKIWDKVGWTFHSLGYILILNAIGLLLHGYDFKIQSISFIGLTILLFTIYSCVDIFLDFLRWKEKLFKLFFYILFIFVGSILPIVLG
jgi:carbon starvation protein CstA